MRNGRTLEELARELTRQLETKKDLVLPPSAMRHETDGQGETRLVIDHPDGGRFAVTELARRQLAGKLNIPYAYFERMRTEQQDLLDRNVNTWLQCDEGHKMVRTLDGQARAHGEGTGRAGPVVVAYFRVCRRHQRRARHGRRPVGVLLFE